MSFSLFFGSSWVANPSACSRDCWLGGEQKLESLGSGVEERGKIPEGTAF